MNGTGRARRRELEEERPGLFSLAQIQYLLKVEFGRGLRYGHAVMAMIVAVDGMDELSERAGYAAKERALEEAIALTRRETRPFDFVGRLSGDRLLVVVPQVRPERADTLAKRLIRKAHDVRLEAIEPGLALALSIGCGLMVPGLTLFHDELLSTARGALEEAQAQGGDRCVLREARGGGEL
jgi:diguanylate cyclase (GGDEF)-like protein